MLRNIILAYWLIILKRNDVKQKGVNMAIISCPECGKQISSEAEKCPHCGYPIDKNSEIIQNKIENSSAEGGTNTFCVVVFVLALLGFLAPINIVLSIIALNCRKKYEKGLGLGLTALFLSIVECPILLALLANM